MQNTAQLNLRSRIALANALHPRRRFRKRLVRNFLQSSRNIVRDELTVHAHECDASTRCRAQNRVLAERRCRSISPRLLRAAFCLSARTRSPWETTAASPPRAKRSLGLARGGRSDRSQYRCTTWSSSAQACPTTSDRRQSGTAHRSPADDNREVSAAANRLSFLRHEVWREPVPC